ncbi:MAG: hypothetical protein A3H27_16335 [Acidobacteria bacterium RIFCSPLOWO2_02_FULL_59_13]|nr:MAG: hypothetical protein A3H27_16335 [Acidobacteria bacterium RIFCSPLOWO2_02_FULL_59_13]
MDPEKNYGLVGYEPLTPVPLLRGERGDWEGAQQLASSADGKAAPGELRALYAKSDFAYLYVRLDVQPAAFDWDHRNYWIALNTLPGQAGSRLLPGAGVRLDSGSNFLIQLTGPFSSRILIAENYNPNQRVPQPGRFGVSRMRRKTGMKVGGEDTAPFEEIVMEVNQPRYGRDGRVFPSLEFNRSPFPFGIADRNKAGFSSHALWNGHEENGMIELRIPWGLLLITDPSNWQAFGGTDEKLYATVPGEWLPKSQTMPGVSIAAFSVAVSGPEQPESNAVTSALPPVGDDKTVKKVPLYTWQKWNQIHVRPYFKPSYFALQKVFAELAVPPPPPPDSSRSAGDPMSR